MPPASNRLPSKAGIGLRAPHVNEVLAQRPDVAFFEVHSENYYLDGGPALASLARIRADYPLSLHGVGMSLGSADPLDLSHVEKLRTLIARIEPALVSEHLCWSGIAGRHLNDLFPLPYTDEALALACARVAELQERLGRAVAIENISSYLTFADSTIPEWDFVDEDGNLIPHTAEGFDLIPADLFTAMLRRGNDALKEAALPANLNGSSSNVMEAQTAPTPETIPST